MIEGMNTQTEYQPLRKGIDNLKYSLVNLSKEIFEIRKDVRTSKEQKKHAQWVMKNNQAKSEKSNSNPDFMDGEVSSKK